MCCVLLVRKNSRLILLVSNGVMNFMLISACVNKAYILCQLFGEGNSHRFNEIFIDFTMRATTRSCAVGRARSLARACFLLFSRCNPHRSIRRYASISVGQVIIKFIFRPDAR